MTFGDYVTYELVGSTKACGIVRGFDMHYKGSVTVELPNRHELFIAKEYLSTATVNDILKFKSDRILIDIANSQSNITYEIFKKYIEEVKENE